MHRFLFPKEEAAEAKKVKRLTAKQAQRNKDNEMWEKNRMFRSGAVTRCVQSIESKGARSSIIDMD